MEQKIGTSNLEFRLQGFGFWVENEKSKGTTSGKQNESEVHSEMYIDRASG